MENGRRYSNTLRIRVDPELLELVRKEAEKLNIDVSTYVRWCIRTGLYLGDLNLFIRSRSNDGSLDELTRAWNR